MTIHLTPEQAARLQKNLRRQPTDCPQGGVLPVAKARKPRSGYTDAIRVLSKPYSAYTASLRGFRHEVVKVDNERWVTLCMVEFHRPGWRPIEDITLPRCKGCEKGGKP